MTSVEKQKQQQLQRQYYETVREEFARENLWAHPGSRMDMWIRWLCRLLTYITPFGICVNYSKTDGSPYRLNVHLTPAWLPWGIDLHHFFRDDQEPEYHNHPWFIGHAWILLHGYVEHLLEKDTRRRLTKYRGAKEWNTLHNTNVERTWHRLELYKNSAGIPLRSWTLFFHGRRIKDEKDGISSWGFFNADTMRYTGWRQFVNQPPSRTERPSYELEVSVYPDPTPMFGTDLSAAPDTFDTDNCPTTPIPKEILKEIYDAKVRAGIPGEQKPVRGSADQEGTP